MCVCLVNMMLPNVLNEHSLTYIKRNIFNNDNHSNTQYVLPISGQHGTFLTDRLRLQEAYACWANTIVESSTTHAAICIMLMPIVQVLCSGSYRLHD